MKAIKKHWPRIAVTLIPLMFALLHASGVMPLGVIHRLDEIIYDARLRATMPQTRDDRIVIVDIDEKSLSEVGRWPWGRNKLAELIRNLFQEQQIALLGVDVVFAEPDRSSGLDLLIELATNEFKNNSAFSDKVQALKPQLDYDQNFADALAGKPVVLGYFFTNDAQGRSSGHLPAPVFTAGDLNGRLLDAPEWPAYGSNLDLIAKAAPLAGHFNSVTDSDGVVRSIPLVARYKGAYYESLSLAMFRAIVGLPKVVPQYSSETYLSRENQALNRLLLVQGDKTLGIPVDGKGAALIPYRGYGNAQGGSFTYISATDIINKRIPQGSLKNKILLLGTTALGLFDMRVTPVGETYPGVETHANLISALLDGHVLVKPDFAVGYEIAVLLISGVALAIFLPLLNASRAVILSATFLVGTTLLNLWLYLGYGIVLPLASEILMCATAFAINMSYGYFVESKSKRNLANLFGTYVPPELVDEMLEDPDSYSMRAANKEMTVMFCDMRGFTTMSETMEPLELQAMLTSVFSRLTGVIRGHRGTIDKYMGDCVMAFWGAPIETKNHAYLAVTAALDIAHTVREINLEHQRRGLPSIGIGVGLSTGLMCVGDMGSNIRRSYTVIGDAVNLGSRLESLSKIYGVEVVASEETRKMTDSILWQELDKVRVKGKDRPVTIFTPLMVLSEVAEEVREEMKLWSQFLKLYREQNWERASVMLLNVSRINPDRVIYQLYAKRISSMQHLPYDPKWDGATNFDSK